MSLRTLAFAPMMTVEDLIKALSSIPSTTWITSDDGPLNLIEYEAGANEPFIILNFGGNPNG